MGGPGQYVDEKKADPNDDPSRDATAELDADVAALEEVQGETGEPGAE